ncbi:MAG: zinc ribbon domain-containing protein [Candidatus Aenigmarchaeota archaeon]|nr:zinc ribbon domain-containing protein [Candidatus Aenigmarchaeota archaeon]
MEASGEPQNPAVPQVQPQQAPAGQTGAYPEQASGGVLFVLKCIWLFILGAILAVVGLITLLTRPDMGTNPFIIMLMGLMFTAIGSIYGKRKLAGQAAVADYVVDPAQMLQIRPVDTPPQPQQQQQMQPFPTYPAYPSYPQSVQQRPAETPRIQQPAQPSTQLAQAEQPSGIKRIFVCPKCGAENEMDDKFCYKCGFKFTKPKKKPAKKAAKTKTEKEKPILKSKPAAKPKPAPKKALVAKKKIPKETV